MALDKHDTTDTWRMQVDASHDAIRENETCGERGAELPEHVRSV